MGCYLSREQKLDVKKLFDNATFFAFHVASLTCGLLQEYYDEGDDCEVDQGGKTLIAIGSFSIGLRIVSLMAPYTKTTWDDRWIAAHEEKLEDFVLITMELLGFMLIGMKFEHWTYDKRLKDNFDDDKLYCTRDSMISSIVMLIAWAFDAIVRILKMFLCLSDVKETPEELEDRAKKIRIRMKAIAIMRGQKPTFLKTDRLENERKVIDSKYSDHSHRSKIKARKRKNI